MTKLLAILLTLLMLTGCTSLSFAQRLAAAHLAEAVSKSEQEMNKNLTEPKQAEESTP